MAKYIEETTLNNTKKQLLFRLRSRTLDVKKNFGGNNSNQWCISCGKASKIDENHIYADLKKQIEIVNIYSDIIQEREKLQSQKFRENIPQSEGPVHPSHQVGVL